MDIKHFRVAKYHGNTLLCSVIEKTNLLTIFCSAKSIKRISRKSFMKVLPYEILGMLGNMLFPEVRDDFINDALPLSDDE